ncbi:DUF2752 domain-containing protein [candidate division KSB1 bacterium]|nr:DUF2752 domain-containing protein [candidate division KSB1 bacterium]
MNRFIRPRQASNKFNDLFILIATIIILGASFILSVDDRSLVRLPTKNIPPIPRSCLTKRIFDIDCPVCGLTRSIIYYSHGDFEKGWHCHRLGLLVYFLFLIQIPYRLFTLITHKSIAIFSDYKFISRTSYILIALFLVNWIYNLVSGTMTP